MTAHDYLNPRELHHALVLRDLSDPDQGPHAMQLVLEQVVGALAGAWGCPVHVVRTPPLVAVHDNYDRLGYPPGDVTRDRRHTRYTSPTTMLRSHTSAQLPGVLDRYRDRRDVDELIVVPGLVYRRDVVDRTHVGEPHQVDLWRIRATPVSTPKDLLAMVGVLVEAVMPGAQWRTTPATHPYTLAGLQVEVRHDGQWLELAECGLIHPRVLHRSGLDPRDWSGLALGMGLERALMLRKGIPDIRYLRAEEPRIAAQLQDLDQWRAVSVMPPIRRDLSVVIDAGLDDESVGDVVRTALGRRVDDLESVEVRARTSYGDLPDAARVRLGIRPGQVNALVRLTIRPLERTLTDAEANTLRNDVYRALHRGPTLELAT